MPNPYEVYRKQRAASWTRVDMVVALFDEAIKQIDDATKALVRNNHVAARQHCLRVVQVIDCLRSGVDEGAGKVPQDILRLYHFVDRCVTSSKLADLDAARNVLTPIRESYLEIRDLAAKMEHEGQIPALQL